jgi:hypothetical protein
VDDSPRVTGNLALTFAVTIVTLRWVAILTSTRYPVINMAITSLEAALTRRLELIEEIARCADAICALDRAMPVLKSMALEADLLQAEKHAL